VHGELGWSVTSRYGPEKEIDFSGSSASKVNQSGSFES
jgi:hypothetical protein